MGMMMNSGGRAGRKRASKPMSDINVTPLVDVMLVLLIIFMVTAPLLTVGVPVDLPKTQAQAIAEQTEPLVITINNKDEVFIQETQVEVDGLVAKLQAITDQNKEARIFVRGDKVVEYGKVLDVMGRINAAGFTKVALIAEAPQGEAPSAKESAKQSVSKSSSKSSQTKEKASSKSVDWGR